MEWITSVKSIIDFLFALSGQKKEKRKEIYEAIEAIKIAVIKTNEYIKQVNGNIETNIVFSELWMDVASKVRDIDTDLYNRLLDKSQYWSDPKGWSEEDVVEAKIKLTDMEADADRLLKSLRNKKQTQE